MLLLSDPPLLLLSWGGVILFHTRSKMNDNVSSRGKSEQSGSVCVRRKMNDNVSSRGKSESDSVCVRRTSDRGGTGRVRSTTRQISRQRLSFKTRAFVSRLDQEVAWDPASTVRQP